MSQLVKQEVKEEHHARAVQKNVENRSRLVVPTRTTPLQILRTGLHQTAVKPQVKMKRRTLLEKYRSMRA